LLKEIAWWDWTREQLQEAFDDFRECDAEQFAIKHLNPSWSQNRMSGSRP
jgi:hypothetical protein